MRSLNGNNVFPADADLPADFGPSHVGGREAEIQTWLSQQLSSRKGRGNEKMVMLVDEVERKEEMQGVKEGRV